MLGPRVFKLDMKISVQNKRNIKWVDLEAKYVPKLVSENQDLSVKSQGILFHQYLADKEPTILSGDPSHLLEDNRHLPSLLHFWSSIVEPATKAPYSSTDPRSRVIQGRTGRPPIQT
ncbi:hypothetical protein DPMN_035142 [Dreissena polymorpha]|uniref:Uncharacterized protein n=1 Tax=Dreissena polymorpha TaxID=45954 RepID=A0A9D4M6R4_DREPO|nr:hypothetical protein DPMN_035142 [Dreissena polymorpha]